MPPSSNTGLRAFVRSAQTRNVFHIISPQIVYVLVQRPKVMFSAFKKSGGNDGDERHDD